MFKIYSILCCESVLGKLKRIVVETEAPSSPCEIWPRGRHLGRELTHQNPCGFFLRDVTLPLKQMGELELVFTFFLHDLLCNAPVLQRTNGCNSGSLCGNRSWTAICEVQLGRLPSCSWRASGLLPCRLEGRCNTSLTLRRLTFLRTRPFESWACPFEKVVRGQLGVVSAHSQKSIFYICDCQVCRPLRNKNMHADMVGSQGHQKPLYDDHAGDHQDRHHCRVLNARHVRYNMEGKFFLWHQVLFPTSKIYGGSKSSILLLLTPPSIGEPQQCHVHTWAIPSNFALTLYMVCVLTPGIFKIWGADKEIFQNEPFVRDIPKN